MVNFWVYNAVDIGQSPLSPAQITPAREAPSLQFRFPNLWQNWISDSFRIMVAFVPIDDENTLLYLRTYQKMVKFPPLRAIFNLFGYLGNRVIIKQDQRVVETQRPMRSYLRMGEKLIPGDGPIIEYRRRRQALIEAVRTSAS
jgi:phenylpropionate dioxygenase-like ring-hydroxylating dioxygenase large terminal subunit